MGKVKYVKISLDNFGSYLGMEKGCYIIKHKNGNIERYPQFENEIGEVILKSGNMVSVGALANFGFWDIDVLIMTQKGRPVAILKSVEDDSHVETRICQYEALKNGKGLYIAKQFLIGKIEGQNILLNKYGLKTQLSVNQIINGFNEHDLVMLRRRLNHFEGKVSQRYFKQIFQLFPEKMRPTNRKGFQAYDGINNIFNLSYKLLFWKCYRALIKCHLEPYLGFLHCIQPYRASLVCDLVELYRYLVDDFLIDYCKSLKPRDFVAKTEKFNDKKGKRIYLNDRLTRDLTRKLHDYFRREIKIPRIKRGEKQELETLINEEAMLLGKYLRDERETWIPRIGILE